MTRTSNFRHVVTVQRPVVAKVEGGGRSGEWREVGKYRARIRRTAWDENPSPIEVTATARAIFKVRAAASLEGVAESWRLSHDGAFWNIRGVWLTDDRSFYEILAERGVGT